jgi:hypothetical protein
MICRYGDTTVSLQRGEETVDRYSINKYSDLVNP